MEIDLENKLLKAKIDLMSRSVFISTIALSVRHIITDSVETAATDNLTIEYNPAFITKLTIPELCGLMAHECWHIAYMHLLRRGERDPLIWNYAGDYVINNGLIKAGFELPQGGLIDSKYDSEWSTDQVYDAIYTDPPKGSNVILDVMGEPASGTEDDPKSAQAVKDILVRAQTQSQMSGKESGEIPAEISRIIDKLLNPKVPWEVVLNKFLDQRIHDEYSWARRNRRHKAYMPSLYNYGLGHLTFAIDTSGSQDDDDLIGTLSEIKGIRDTFNPEKMTILDCDASIHNVYTIDQNTNIMDLKFSGGGGTRFQPVLDYITENPVQALVYFTDLYGENHLDEVSYPILWICNSDHEPAPIGTTVYVDP